MFAASLAAFGYADIAVLVILALFTVLCCCMGLSKSFKGFFATVLAILLSLFVVGSFSEQLQATGIGQGLEDKLVESSAGWGQAFTSDAILNNDGTVSVLVDGELVSISSCSDNKLGTFFANKLAPKFITATAENGETQTLAGQIVSNLTALIISAIFFLVCLIVLLVIFALLRKIMKSASNSEHKVGKVFDKILGAVVGAVFGLMIVFLALAIIKACQNVGSTQTFIDNYITSSTITNWFYENNFIGKMFEDIFVAK